ncbi:MAG: PD-(D/E)XK nuclease family protein [bacterium]
MNDMLAKVISDLKVDPLFNISLSSKELFHSNFWKWMWEVLDKKMVISLFSDTFVYEEDMICEREKSHIDLMIGNGKRTLYIENKVKNVFHNTQLEEYIAKHKKHEGDEFVLVTMYPVSEKLPEGWKHITYERILEKLKTVKHKYSSVNTYIEGYSLLIRKLLMLYKVLPQHKYYDFYRCAENDEFISALKTIKMHDFYIKYRAGNMVGYIFDKLEADERFKGRVVFGLNEYEKAVKGSIVTNWSFNRGKPTMDFIYCLGDAVGIGIQIEAEQYRKFLWAGKNCQQTAKKLLDEDIWFDKKFTYKGNKTLLGYKGKNGLLTSQYQYDKGKPIAYWEQYIALYNRIFSELTYIDANSKKISKLVGYNR